MSRERSNLAPSGFNVASNAVTHRDSLVTARERKAPSVWDRFSTRTITVPPVKKLKNGEITGIRNRFIPAVPGTKSITCRDERGYRLTRGLKKRKVSATTAKELLTIAPIDPHQELDDIPKMPLGEAIGFHPFRSLFSGASGSGKSTLFDNLIRKFWKDYFDRIHIFCASLDTDPCYRALIEDGIIDRKDAHDKLDFAKIEQIRQEATADIKSNGLAKAKRRLIWVDDFASDPRLMSNPMFVKIAFHFRHLSCSLGLSVQKYNTAVKKLRTNCTHLFIFKPENVGELESIAEEQASPYLPGETRLEKKKGFFEMFHTYTRKPHSFITINRQDPDVYKMYRSGLDQIINFEHEEVEEEEPEKKSKRRKKKLSNNDGLLPNPKDETPTVQQILGKALGSTQPGKESGLITIAQTPLESRRTIT